MVSQPAVLLDLYKMRVGSCCCYPPPLSSPPHAHTSHVPHVQAGSEFMLPLANAETLALLGVSVAELTELCAACTHFVRFVLDELQDDPAGQQGAPPPLAAAATAAAAVQG